MKIGTLFNCEKALAKLLKYGLLPVGQTFYLRSVQDKIMASLSAYCATRNGLLAKYGTSGDNREYLIPPDKKEEFISELETLDNQEIDISFPPEKITLCVESIGKAEKDLSADKRLGFSANDWAAIQGIIEVVETEE